MKKTKFPWTHHIDEKNKIVNIYWNGNGQIGRYGVPHIVRKFYPGYSYEFIDNNEEKN